MQVLFSFASLVIEIHLEMNYKLLLFVLHILKGFSFVLCRIFT